MMEATVRLMACPHGKQARLYYFWDLPDAEQAYRLWFVVVSEGRIVCGCGHEPEKSV